MQKIAVISWCLPSRLITLLVWQKISNDFCYLISLYDVVRKDIGLTPFFPGNCFSDYLAYQNHHHHQNHHKRKFERTHPTAKANSPFVRIIRLPSRYKLHSIATSEVCMRFPPALRRSPNERVCTGTRACFCNPRGHSGVRLQREKWKRKRRGKCTLEGRLK